MTAPRFKTSVRTIKQAFSASLFLGISAIAITGCGVSSFTHTDNGTIALHGTVHGGQQPVANATIQLYAAGKLGNRSAALPMISKRVTTLSDGTFNITGDYSCAAADDQVYLVATGGNPGLTPTVNNPALVLITAFGSCSNLPLASNVEINEVTTAAAAWALAPFMSSATTVGASSTNAKGLASAFLNAQLLADSSRGLAATLPSTLTIETGKLYALADALAPCVNSDGTTGCNKLFSAATTPSGAIPANTLNAALNIVQNPGHNVAAVFSAINAQAPFATTLSKAPNDWTMSLTITGGALHSPGALAVDGFNNIWVANYPGTISAFTAQGAPFTSTGYGAGILSEVYGLAVDFNNNVWATNEEYPGHYPAPTSGSITAFHGAEPGTVGSVLFGNYIFDSSIDYPFAIAADPNGDMLIVNNAGSSVTEYTNQGAFVTSGLAGAEASLPVAIAPDLNHGFWLANEGDSSVTHIDKNGNLLARAFCCDGANGVATDSLGNAWIANFYAGSISELASDGTVEATTTGGGLSNVTDPADPNSNEPSGIAVDAGQNVWIANFFAANFSNIAGSATTLAAGTAISPSTGYGLDAHLVQPFAIAPDAGGNLWISDFGKSSITMFFGLATPTKTPLLPSPTAP
jgi:hypothetical protein